MDSDQTYKHLSDQLDSISLSSGSSDYTDTININTVDLGGIGSIDLSSINASMTFPSQSVYLGPNTSFGTGAVGSNGYTFNPNVTVTSGSSTGMWTTDLNQGGKLSLHGKNADIEVDGKSMVAWMEKVEERLNILTPNPELEKEWDDLRKLGERYRKLEKKCKEKAEVWNKLKKL